MSGVPADADFFRRQLTSFLEALSVRPVFVATIYDPSFGDDQDRVLGIEPGPVRVIHRAFNAALADAGRRAGLVIDVHAHFMGGDRDWFVPCRAWSAPLRCVAVSGRPCPSSPSRTWRRSELPAAP
jgi:hypothetical protein